MEKKTLKAGDSFDVVEVVSSNFLDEPFLIGGYTINLDGINTLINNPEYFGYSKSVLGQRVLCLPSYGERLVGKLTITKVK